MIGMSVVLVNYWIILDITTWAFGFVIFLPKLNSLYVPHMDMSMEMIQMDQSW